MTADKKYKHLKIPTIHLNGTSGRNLFAQVREARNAVGTALEVHAAAAPHGRDYYPQGDAVWMIAHDQWSLRQNKLYAAQSELTYLMHQIYDALSKRDKENL